MTLTYDAYAGALATLDGTTVTVAAFTSGYVPSPSDADLDAIDANEVDTGDAAGYARQTVGVTWDVAARRLTFDDPIEFDLDGASDVQHFVVADASGDLAFVLSYDTPIEGYDGFTLSPPVAASEADTAGIEARLVALETAPGPPSPVPDPTGAPDGKVIKTLDGALVLGDGGVQSITAGTGVTIGGTAANPVVSVTGGGGGGGVPIGVATTIVSGSSSPIFHNVSGDIDTDTGVLVVTPPDDTEHPGDLTIVLTGLPDGPRAPLTVYMPVDGSRWHQLQVGEVDLISTGPVGYVSTTVTWIGEGEMRALRPTGADSAPYRPDNGSNWASSPSRVSYALDELAARIKALEP